MDIKERARKALEDTALSVWEYNIVWSPIIRDLLDALEEKEKELAEARTAKSTRKMKCEEIAVGQIWERRDGRKVMITAKGSVWPDRRAVLLTSIDTGRKTWKVEEYVIKDLRMVEAGGRLQNPQHDNAFPS